MTVVKVRIENGTLPEYMSGNASGADVRAANEQPITIPAKGTARIPTGIFLEIPQGFEVQVRPRSGLAFKHGVTILNAPGTIDADYRGEVQVLLVNHGDSDFEVKKGERIAQLVVAKVEKAHFEPAESLSDTARGHGGFGSTGKH
ncbi:MAG: dUTP diphosphatase [Candidatus Micrarchaeota archaeon]|nr:dUTP diphosphatase [Candidatus Micrarchaeota archaeon]